MKRFFTLMLIAISLFVVCDVEAFASSLESPKYYFDSVVNTEKNNGYSGQNPLDSKDPHNGWRLGRFVVSGYTRMVVDDNGNPVFLKAPGDKVTLSFTLEMDIDTLNNDNTLLISDDKNGYDRYFEVDKTKFGGRGTLIVSHTDYQNTKREPIVYKDYLSSFSTADKEVNTYEEGDYEVALNYKIELKNKLLFVPTPSTYNDYRIFFKFSVRNENCTVFPRDAITGADMANNSIAVNGFFLDLAKSRYLIIDIKREVLLNGNDVLTEDRNFRKPAYNGELFTDEGVYIITVKNQYTGMETEKMIYVGSDPILKAFMKTGFTIKHINEQLALGATITDDGIIIPPPSDCVIYAYDLDSKIELTDKSITENGFYLDFEEFPHLNIIVIKEILTNANDGLTEDTQFNNFAKTGDKYTEEGIYTVIAINRSSEMQISMKICVGTNKILKAHMTTGFSIKEIKAQEALGALITDDGEILPPTVTVAQIDDALSHDFIGSANEENDLSYAGNNSFVLPASISILALVIAVVTIIMFRKYRRKNVNDSQNKDVFDTTGKGESE